MYLSASHARPVCKTTKRKQIVRIFEQHVGFEKKGPGHTQVRIASKLVFDDCSR